MRTSEEKQYAAAVSPGVYEAGALRQVTGTTIRPGGLELTERAVDFCRFDTGAKLLDVGCGAGATVEHLASRYRFDARGVDLSPRLVAEGLQRNPALELAVGTAEGLDFSAAALDGLFCECVLSLVKEPLRALAEFRRVLRPGGYLVMSDIYDRGIPDAAPARPYAPSSGTAARWELVRLLSLSGFSLLLWEDHTLALKELAARLMLAHGSLDGFCCAADAVRPGYYLLVAGKL